MTGSYPDVPAPRMAHDRDGTTIIRVDFNSGTISQLGNNINVLLNNEASDSYVLHSTSATYGVQGYPCAICFLFPELRDVLAYAMNVTWSSGEYTTADGIEVSTNTTNGLDGTWTNIWSNWPFYGDYSKPALRNAIRTLPSPALGIKGIRFRIRRTDSSSSNFTLRNLHLFGGPSAGQAPDRLRLWDETLDQEIGGAFFDWGDVARSTSADKTFRVYNPSTLTATSVALTSEVLTDATPSLLPQHLFSFNGSAFATSVDIGDIPPGTASGPITLRRVTSSGAALSLWWLRIVAAAANYV